MSRITPANDLRLADGQGDEEALSGGQGILPDDDDDDDREEDMAVSDMGKAMIAQGQNLSTPLAYGLPGLQMDFQTRTAEPMAVMVTAEGCGPLASSIALHEGRANLSVMDQASAAAPSLHPQLRAAPTGNPHMSSGVGDRQAPSGYGQSGATPVRPEGPAALTSVRGLRSAPVVSVPNAPFVPARRAPGE